MKILLAGDTHGNAYHMQNVMAHACRVEADIVFQLGDFGYGWHFVDRRDAYSQQVASLVQQAGTPCFWLDGNHENHVSLQHRTAAVGPRSETDPTIEIEQGVFYVPRGTLLEWGGVKFLCCGGATSVDREHRKEGSSWWAEEAITEEDVLKCIAAGPADVLLSHDFPWEVNVVDRHLAPYWGERAQTDTIASRQKISWIVRESGVQRVFHGHLHIRYDEDIVVEGRTVHVTGLDCDSASVSLSTLLIDTEDLK